MSLGKTSKPATLEDRLVAGALQPSVVTKVLTCYEPRETPEVPNHVNGMAEDEEAMESVVDATVAGVTVQTGTKETVGTDTLTVIGGLANVVDSERRLRPTDRPGRLSVLRKLLSECLDQMENTAE